MNAIPLLAIKNVQVLRDGAAAQYGSDAIAGNIKNLFPAAGANTRIANAVVYATPVMSGFSAEALYALGEQAGSSEAGRQFGLGLNYAQGDLNARLVYNNRNNDTVAVGTTPAAKRESGRNTLLAVNYDFKVVKAFFAYGDDKGLNSAALPVANAYGYAVAPRASRGFARYGSKTWQRMRRARRTK